MGLALMLSALVPIGGATGAAAPGPPSFGVSPALCGPDDVPEPGIQGDVPVGTTPEWHCGLEEIGQLPRSGPLQGSDHCVYIRSGGRIWVVDVSDPENPVEVGDVPAVSSSETMRAITTDDRALLVSGRSVYDISDCENPVALGQIEWRMFGAFESSQPSHDIRVNRQGTEVWASTAIKEVDISNLADPTTWKAKNHRCAVARQAGHPLHMAFFPDWCAMAGDFPYPTYIHGPDFNDTGSRMYIGSQGTISTLTEEDMVRILDITGATPQLLATAPGPGHSVDWFRTADGRQYILHANEGDSGDTCQPYPRPSSLGWAYEAFITEATGDTLSRTSMVELAINKPEFCEERATSGRGAVVSYHAVDNPDNASFAMISFGKAGLRVFDIRNPANPVEIAYFNHGPLQHASVPHYDASQGIIYAPTSNGLRVLKVSDQVLDHLGDPVPDPWEPGDGQPPVPPKGKKP